MTCKLKSILYKALKRFKDVLYMYLTAGTTVTVDSFPQISDETYVAIII